MKSNPLSKIIINARVANFATESFSIRSRYPRRMKCTAQRGMDLGNSSWHLLNANELGHRTRVDVPGLYRDPLRAAEVERKLALLRGVNFAHANVKSGRVLIVTSRPMGELRTNLDSALHEASDNEALSAPSWKSTFGGAIRAVIGMARAPARIWRHRHSFGEAFEPETLARPWHAMTTEDVLAALDVDPKGGLVPGAAAARVAVEGANLFPRMPRRTPFRNLRGE